MQRNNRTSILFIESGSLFGYSGFTQQFLMEAKALKEEGVNVKVIAFESLRDIVRKKSGMYRKILKKQRVHYFIVPSWFRQNAVAEIIFNTINTVILGFIAFLNSAKIIHAHDRVSAYYAIRLKTMLNLKVIYDMHGVGIEELIYKKDLKENSVLHNQFNQMEDNIVKKADAIFCVSEKMKAYVVSKYNADGLKIVVTPTNVDTDVFSYSEEKRQQAIQKLFLRDKFVVLFMGHINKWQVNGSFAILFRTLKERIENVHFLILSDGRKVFVDIFKKLGISERDYSIYSAKHEEVPNYALAGDIGVLLRDNSIVNKVAAPAKFGEYLALGIPVIVTRGIGDTEEFVKKHKVGSVIDDFSHDSISTGVDGLLNLVRNDGAKLPEHCSQIAKDLLSVSVCIKRCVSTYERLLS